MPTEVQLPHGWPPGFGLTPDERSALMVLSSLRGIAPRGLRALAWEAGSARGCLDVIRAGGAGSRADRDAAREASADAVARDLAALDGRLIGPGDPEYPGELLDLFDPPAAVFARGAPLDAGRTRVAMVGARSASRLGVDAARTIARDLAAAGVEVVSGAAQGIDRASHEGALEAGGPTIAVLGCGIDRDARPRGSSLIARIRAAGTIVSEYPPGVPPAPYRFPARNRLIAALSRSVVVVEGRCTSGSMITARHGLDLGRSVYAVPGAITNLLAEAPHALIRDGAILLRDAADLLDDLGIEPEAAHAVGAGRPEPGTLDAAALVLLDAPVLPEKAARRLDVSVPQLIAALMRLELSRLVRAVGGRYERTVSGTEIARRLQLSTSERDGPASARSPGRTPPAA